MILQTNIMLLKLHLLVLVTWILLANQTNNYIEIKQLHFQHSKTNF